MPPFFKSVSGISLIAVIALLALQAFPYPGIVLMILQAAFFTGLLIHVFLVALLVEVFLGRVPRALVALPLVAYAGYYVRYVHQTIEIRQKSAQLQQENSGKIFDFDPGVYSLITPDAEKLVTEYAVPVVYKAVKDYSPENHLSFRLMPWEQCSAIPIDTRNRILKSAVQTSNFFQNNLCLLRFPEDPPKKVITAVKHRDEEVWKGKWDIGEQVTEILVDGRKIGSFKTASVWRLPMFPILAIGCFLGDGKWACGADFFTRSFIEIDTIPGSVDHAKYGSPESVMLGIPRYTSTDLVNFQGYRESDQALAHIAGEPKRVADDSFAILQQIVDGQSPSLPFNLGFSLASDPERLVPFAEPMAKRLLELVTNNQAHKLDRGQPNVLETALAALPVPVFAPVSDTIFDVIRQNKGWDRFPRLYVRAAESGAKTLAFYESHFMSEQMPRSLRFLPVLAICRIGQASPQVVEEMKKRFIGASSDDQYQSALLVTLVRLGERPFIKDNMPVKVGGNYRGWAEAVLSGSGMTAVGPNNCMAKEWGLSSYIGAVMAPTLVLKRGEWSIQSKT